VALQILPDVGAFEAGDSSHVDDLAAGRGREGGEILALEALERRALGVVVPDRGRCRLGRSERAAVAAESGDVDRSRARSRTLPGQGLRIKRSRVSVEMRS
jgi:hypothetical protein